MYINLQGSTAFVFTQNQQRWDGLNCPGMFYTEGCYVKLKYSFFSPFKVSGLTMDSIQYFPREPRVSCKGIRTFSVGFINPYLWSFFYATRHHWHTKTITVSDAFDHHNIFLCSCSTAYFQERSRYRQHHNLWRIPFSQNGEDTGTYNLTERSGLHIVVGSRLCT